MPMAAGDPAFKLATLADVSAAEAQGRRVELLGGTLVEKEAAGNRHSSAHDGIYRAVPPLFHGRGDDAHPGGWVFRIDPHVLAIGGDVVQPDIAGWRRERAPVGDAFPITVAPDWVCEVVYTSHSRDIVQKTRIYQAMGVGHYWIVDLKAMTLTVYRWTGPGYILVIVVEPVGLVRLEPFDAVELPAWQMFGLDDPR